MQAGTDPYRNEVALLMGADGAAYRARTVWWLMVGIMPIVMSATVINVAVPDLRRWFSASHAEVQALSSVFLGAMTVALLASASLIGRLGVRATYRWLIIGFVASSLAAALLPPQAMPLLVLLRAVQGVICGTAQALAMLVIIGIHPVQQRGRAVALYGIGISLSPTLGPFVGGILTSLTGWQALFLFSLPLCIWSWLRVAAMLPHGAPDDLPRSLRLAPLLWLGVFVGALLASFPHWRPWPWLALACCMAAACGLMLFVRDQRRHRQRRMIDFAMLRLPGVRAAALIGFASGAGMYGTTYLLPVYLQDLGGWAAWQAGLLLLPGGLLLGAAMMLGGVLSDRFSIRWTLLAGLTAFLLSNAAFLWALYPVSLGLVLGFTLLGRIGLGLTTPSLTAGATRVAPDSHASTVTVMINFARSLGGALGVGAVGLLLEFGAAAPQASLPLRLGAYWNAFALMALAFVPALLAWHWLRPHEHEPAPVRLAASHPDPET